MSTTIRLQRQGKKKKALYQMVVTDSRSKRDGKFIEKLGTFNPRTEPATVVLNFDRALYWAKTGAELSNAMRTVLSSQGVLLKKHLDGGVLKGALTQEQADAKFQTWLDGKKGEADKKAKSTVQSKADAKKKQFEAEKAANAVKAEALKAKLAEKAKAEAAAAVVEETPAAEATATEEPKAE